MENTAQMLKELINEVFSENKTLLKDDLAYMLLESIRVTSLEEMKPDFKGVVKKKLKFNLRQLNNSDLNHSKRKVSTAYIDKLIQKAIELISLKIKNIDNDQNSIGEFLYEDYTFIHSGLANFEETLSGGKSKQQYVLTGKVISKKVQKGKVKTPFAYLTLQDLNGLKLIVLVSSTFYPQYENELNDIVGRFIGISGEVQYNNYFKSNIIKAFDLDIPKGYVIGRKPV